MTHILRKGMHKLGVETWHQIRRGDAKQKVLDPASALGVLKGLGRDPFALSTFRKVLTDERLDTPLSRLSDHEVIARIAEGLKTGRLRFVVLAGRPDTVLVGLPGKKAAKPPAPAPAPPPKEKKTYSLTVLVPLDEIFLEAIEDDEATLKSTDGAYNKTLHVVDAGQQEDDVYVRLKFDDVVPGKEYTLIYDTKEDDEGLEVAKVVLFHSRPISEAELAQPMRLDFPFEDSKDF